MCARARSRWARAVSPKPCASRPARTAASAVRKLAEQRLPSGLNGLNFSSVHAGLADVGCGLADRRDESSGTTWISETHASSRMSVPRCFSAWTRAMRRRRAGRSSAPAASPGETPAPPDRRAATDLAARCVCFRAAIFLQHELFKQPHGKAPKPFVSMNSTKCGDGGINSTEPVNCLGDSGCNFFLRLIKADD